MTFTLTINLQTGGVSGTIRGSCTGTLSVTCTNPAGAVVDTAFATKTGNFQTGISGGVSADGAFSASFSGTLATTVQLTTPFTQPGCVGKEPPLPGPQSPPISGTLTGTASASGAVTLTSSRGGSWSGTGSVS